MKIVAATVLLLLAAIAALAQEMPAAQEPDQVAQEAMTTVVVPVAGSVIGANDVQWKTDVVLSNDLRTEATVVIEMPSAPDQPVMILTLAPGQVQRFTDVVSEAFGIDRALSPLLISTNNRRSVAIGVTVYGIHGTDVTAAQPIPVNYGATYYPLRQLQGLSFSEEFRTNIGLVNLSTEAAPFTLALQRLQGRNLAVTHVVIPANTLWHMSVQSLFPLITEGDDFSVLVESGTPDTYCYASVIENATSRARFVQATIGTR
ncbi:MAG TPA: hypothetical protein VFN10_21250, partial [Thermoanaerobaculia bacterium]|nr:hypothetical protein [Thermoanaerobaculia bacterium]